MKRYTTTITGDLEPDDSGECYLASEIDALFSASFAELSQAQREAIVACELESLFSAQAARISALKTALRKIMDEADVSALTTKEFHRECLNSVRTIALLALEGK